MDIPCICPLKDGQTRHEAGDTVTLHERLDFRAATTARNTVAMMKQEDDDVSTAEILAGLTEVYLLLGIASWSVVDDRGKAVEPNKQTIRQYLLSNPDVAMLVGDAADELYSDSVIAPLVARASMSSQPTPMPASTSRTNGSGPKNRTRSKPSSTITTLTDDTEMTSPSLAGVSKS